MIGPAAGAASRLAGSDASGTLAERGDEQRRHGRLGGHGHRQRGRQPARPGQPALEALGATTMPPAPATDSRNPSDVVSSGSTSTMAVDAQRQRAQRRCRPADGHPDRRHRGHPRRPQHRGLGPRDEGEAGEHRQRGHQPRAEATAATAAGAAITMTNAMFCPDTASRCVRPAARKASVMSGGLAPGRRRG